MIQKYEWLNLTSTFQTIHIASHAEKIFRSLRFLSITSKVATSALVSCELVIPGHFNEGIGLII